MLHFNQFVILSAESPEFTEADNQERTERLALMLRRRGFLHKLVEHDGVTSYLVVTNKDIPFLEMVAFDLFQQKSVFVQYSDGHLRRHTKDSTEHLGKLRLVDKEVAEKHGSFTFYPEKEEYYATV